ncbi:MAG: hypothetical protein LBM27_01925 [Lactobacillaceae bacterium]|jgi:hypothetical protein|nr:hypothetical protein [Lactobacillaceae bacterium]
MLDPNYESTIKEGINLLESRQYLKAIKLFEDQYSKTATAELNIYLTSAYFFNEQFERAFETVTDMPGAYTETYELVTLAVNISLKVQQFLFAREFVQKNSNDLQGEVLVKLIEEAENDFRFNNEELIKRLQRNLIYLGDGGLDAQEEKFESGLNLPYKEWKNASQIALLDQFVNPLLKSTILEIFVRLNVDESIEYKWINEKIYKVVPAKQKELLLQPKFKTMAAIVEESDLDDGQKEIVISFVRMYASVIYPRLSVIKDPEKWVRMIIDLVSGEENVLDAPDEIFVQVQKIVDEVMQDIK